MTRETLAHNMGQLKMKLSPHRLHTPINTHIYIHTIHNHSIDKYLLISISFQTSRKIDYHTNLAYHIHIWRMYDSVLQPCNVFVARTSYMPIHCISFMWHTLLNRKYLVSLRYPSTACVIWICMTLFPFC